MILPSYLNPSRTGKYEISSNYLTCPLDYVELSSLGHVGLLLGNYVGPSLGYHVGFRL